MGYHCCTEDHGSSAISSAVYKGSINYLSGEEAAGQCGPDSGPNGIFLVDRCVLLFRTLTVKHARNQVRALSASYPYQLTGVGTAQQ